MNKCYFFSVLRKTILGVSRSEGVLLNGDTGKAICVHSFVNPAPAPAPHAAQWTARASQQASQPWGSKADWSDCEPKDGILLSK